MLPNNDQGSTTCKARTLFYLPHCGSLLTHNLLVANWGPAKLQNVTIFGNSFRGICEAWAAVPTADARRQTPPAAILALCESGTCCETLVRDRDYPVLGAFNDQAMHTFPQWRVPEGLEVEPYDLASTKGVE